ncbi:hypothetical protein VTN02DRAFT_3767 [Thermoascus thermophilus]
MGGWLFPSNSGCSRQWLTMVQIAAAEPGGSNLWSHHISRLLHISLMRLSMFGRERYPFIVWWICNIDLDALFSGAGTGEFVGAMLKNHMLPGPGCLLYPLGPGGYSAIYPEESDSLPLVLQLHHDTFVLAARLGFLAAELRRESISSPFLDRSIGTGSFTHAAQRQKKLFGIREAFKLLWGSPPATLLRQHLDSLPRRPRELLQQVNSGICRWTSSFKCVYVLQANGRL